MGFHPGFQGVFRKEPRIKNCVYFEQFCKKHQFGQNWVLFYRKRYTNGWVIGQTIGIEKVKFSRFGRNIHVRFGRKYPPPAATNIYWFQFFPVSHGARIFVFFVIPWQFAILVIFSGYASNLQTLFTHFIWHFGLLLSTWLHLKLSLLKRINIIGNKHIGALTL